MGNSRLHSAVVGHQTLPLGPLKMPRGGFVKKWVLGLVVTSSVVMTLPDWRMTTSRRVMHVPRLILAWSGRPREPWVAMPPTAAIDRRRSTWGQVCAMPARAATATENRVSPTALAIVLPNILPSFLL